MFARVPAIARRFDPAVAAAFGCIIALLLVGSLYSTSFLSPEYLLQQLQVASFLGLIATGMMIVILLGHIDLSVPWVMTAGAMMSTAAAGWGNGEWLAIPFGILCGAAFGVINGHWRSLSAHTLDDLYPRHQCGCAGPHGPAHRRICATGPCNAIHAFHRDRTKHNRNSERSLRLVCDWGRGSFPLE